MKLKITFILMLSIFAVMIGGNAFAQTLNVTGNNSTCPNGASIIATATGLASPVEYQLIHDGTVVVPMGGGWTSTGNFTGLSAGTYTVKARGNHDDSTIISSTPVTVQVNYTPMSAYVNPVTKMACNSVSGDLTVTATGGSGNYLYGMTPVAQTTEPATYQTSPTFTGLTSGSYKFWVKDGNCTSATIINTTGSYTVQQPVSAAQIGVGSTSLALQDMSTAAGGYKIFSDILFKGSYIYLSEEEKVFYNVFAKDLTTGITYPEQSSINSTISLPAGVNVLGHDIRYYVKNICDNSVKEISRTTQNNPNIGVTATCGQAQAYWDMGLLLSYPAKIIFTDATGSHPENNKIVDIYNADNYVRKGFGLFTANTKVFWKVIDNDSKTWPGGTLDFTMDMTNGETNLGWISTEPNRCSLNKGSMLVNIGGIPSNTVGMTYVVTASDNPLVSIGYTGRFVGGPFAGEYYPEYTLSPKSNDWPQGNYTLMIKSPTVGGCYDGKSMKVTAGGYDPVIKNVVKTATCGSFSFVINGTFSAFAPASSYEYVIISGPAVGTTRNINADGSSQSFSNMPYGTYVVGLRVIGQTCNLITLDPITFSADSAINFDPLKSGGFACGPTGKGDMTVTASTIIDGATLEYSIDGTNWQTSNLFSNINIGTYPVKIRETVCGTVTTQNVSIVATLIATINNKPVESTVCVGDDAKLNINALGATTYTWTFPDGSVHLGKEQNLSAVTPTAAGISSVVVSTATCTSERQYVQLYVLDKPSVSTVANITENKNVSINIPITGIAAKKYSNATTSIDYATTYSWTNDNPSIGLAASGTGAISFVGTNTGTTPMVANIEVTPITDVGCPGESKKFTITILPTEGPLLPITAVKTIVGNPVKVKSGDVLTYNITLANDNNVVRTGVNVSDDIPTTLNSISAISNSGVLTGNKIDWTNLSVPAKGTLVLSFQATVINDLPITIRTIKNTAVVVDPIYPTDAITPEVEVVIEDLPGISITKHGQFVDVNNDGKTNVGDLVEYTFVVKNTGNTTLKNITVSDSNATISGGPIAVLSPGAEDAVTFAGIHIVTQSDIDKGLVYNLATVTGKDPQDNSISENSTDPLPCTTCPVDPICPECTITPLTPSSNISITKHGQFVDVNNDGKTNVGDLVEYTFVVKNTGNTTLKNITVSDNNATLSGGPIAILSPGDEDAVTFTGIHIVTQSDIDKGLVYNLAIVTGTDPQDKSISGESTDPLPCTTCPVDPVCPDCTITPLTPSSSISITKHGQFVDANNDGKTNVGDLVEYTFVVKNTGSTTLKNITVSDNNATINGGPIAVLLPGAEDAVTFTGIHIVTQSDIDKGMVYNLATVTGTDPQDNSISENSTDPFPCTTCPVDPICPDCTITPLTPSSSISITKHGQFVDVNNDGKTNIGDHVEYTFVVKNTGSTTLKNIIVSDDNATISGGPIAVLLPGDEVTFTGIHVITQSDIDKGMVYNLATVTGTDPQDNSISENSTDPLPCTTCPVDPICPDCTITPLTPSSGISITKHGQFVDVDNNGETNVGDVVEYTFVVKNTGSTTLRNITVSDDNATISGGPLTVLSPGDEDVVTFTGIHIITQSDIDKGLVYNLATVTGTDPSGESKTATSTDSLPCTTCPVDPLCPDCTITPLTPSSSISITKHGQFVDVNNDGKTNVGDLVEYTFVVKNTGSTTFKNIIVSDDNAAISGGPIAVLAPGAEDAVTFTGIHIVTQSDIDKGMVYNLAIVTGTDPQDNSISEKSTDPLPCITCPVDPVCPDCTITPLTPNSGISITKHGQFVDVNNDGKTNVGDIVEYTFVVKNTGNTTLKNITVIDDNATISGGPIAVLLPGAEDAVTFTGIHTVVQSDIDKGMVYNLATVTGTDPQDNSISENSTDPLPCTTCPVDPLCPECTITPLTSNSSIAVIKRAVFTDENNDGYAQVGESIKYNFEIKNTGETTLTNIIITDNLPGLVLSGNSITLLPGETNKTNFSGIYMLTQSDLDFGSVTNQAVAEGTTPEGEKVNALSDNENFTDSRPTVIDVVVQDCEIKVFNAVSPNGDGINDEFKIKGLECYPTNTVEIYNRWGVKVFETSNYGSNGNVFKGYSDGRATVSRGDGLPDGTYFYILKYLDNSSQRMLDKSGYLYLKK